MIKTESFGEVIRRYRLEKELPLRKVSAYLDIDQAILSKIERGIREATRKQVLGLASFFGLKADDLLVLWLSDRIVREISGEKNSLKALQAAEEKISYGMNKRSAEASLMTKIHNVVKEFPPIKKAWLFGSFARQDEEAGSDVDVLIDVPEEEEFTLFDIAEIQEKISHAVQRSTDVVMLSALRPQVRKRIQKDMRLIYEA